MGTTFFEKNPQVYPKRADGRRNSQGQWSRKRRNGYATAAQFTIHTYEAKAGTTALAGATYLMTRTTPGSYHWLCDAHANYIHMAPWSGETWHSVPTNNWSVGGSMMMHANEWKKLSNTQRRNLIFGIALGAARFSQWLISQGRDPVPKRILTRAQAMRQEAGFIFHRDTDPGRRTDPANPRDDFPWDEFFAEYDRLLGGATTQEDDMGNVDTISDEALSQIAEAVASFNNNGRGKTKGKEVDKRSIFTMVHDIADKPAPSLQQIRDAQSFHAGKVDEANQRNLNNLVVPLIKAVSNVSGGEEFDEGRLYAGVEEAARVGTLSAKAELTQALLDTLAEQPDLTAEEIAEAVVDKVGVRLTS